MAQQIISKVDIMFKSYFGLLDAKKAGKVTKQVNLPNYLPKDGHYSLIIQEMPWFVNNKFSIPYSRAYSKTNKRIVITLPTILINKKDSIREIRIVPKYNAKEFEIHYTYKIDKQNEVLSNNTVNESALAIDLGISNFATCVSTAGDSFIIDGKRLKCYSQWYNKRYAELESIKTRQKYGDSLTKQQVRILLKRNNRFDDYINKAIKYIIQYCIKNTIQIVVLGYNKNYQLDAHLCKKVNQTYTQFPFGMFKKNLEHKCKLYNIKFIEQEESYTSKASFLDKDDIPVYDPDMPQKFNFSGTRIKRGMYKTSKGILINADVNAAYNILCKSKVVPNAIQWLYNRGELNTPLRIRLHK